MGKEFTDKITLVQPNKVTNARYEFNEIQENIMTFVMDKLQKHMSREMPLQTDLFKNPLVVIEIADIVGESKGNKTHYYKAAVDMMQKVVEYEYNDEKRGPTKTAAALFVAITDVKDTKNIEISLNTWALPYMLYWGAGAGGTIFKKSTALILRGSYTKRLYKMCMQWKTKGYFGMSVDDFRKQMVLEKKYPRKTDLERWVLKPAQDRMKEKAEIYFNYTFDKVGGSRSYNYIHFYIKDNVTTSKEKTDLYVFIFNMLSFAYPLNKSSRASDICEKMSQNIDDFEKLYFRLKRLKNDLEDEKKTHEDVAKLIMHIMKNDFPNY